MTYNLADFRLLLAAFNDNLTNEEGEALSCQLHETEFANGNIRFEIGDTTIDDHHAAEACNVAGVISSVSRILSLPRSTIACEEMSEVLLLRLDVLREYIAALFTGRLTSEYRETRADKTIRRWAGFLKHPKEYVFAHRCLASWDLAFDPPLIKIDTAFLSQWDDLNSKQRDSRKTELAHHPVSVELPETTEITAFFTSCREHLTRLMSQKNRIMGIERKHVLCFPVNVEN